jgi:hypothetical protein
VKTLSLESNQIVSVNYSQNSVILCSLITEKKVILFKLGVGKGEVYILYRT